MLNKVYQLTKPRQIGIQFKELELNSDQNVLVKPHYMAICHADQRYYQGKRDASVLAKKLPMAMIHESSGIVVADPSGTYHPGQKVLLIPNQPPHASQDEFFENYLSGTKFRSSGFDGFMQEVVSLPLDRVVAYEQIDDTVAALGEFTSVAMHAINRFDRVSHSKRESVLVIGDGSLAFVVVNALHFLYPDLSITVVGRNPEKLQLFNFIDRAVLTTDLTDEEKFDHAFECTGGQGSEPAIDMIIDHIRPQGTVVLMGVSDNPVAINTRDILERGLYLVGSSRSGREDFDRAVTMLSDRRIQNRLKNIIYLEEPVETVEDIHRVFSTDLTTSFKTVFKWNM